MQHAIRRAYLHKHEDGIVRVFDVQTNRPIKLEGVTMPEQFHRLVRYCYEHHICHDDHHDEKNYMEIYAAFDTDHDDKIFAWGPHICLHHNCKCLSWHLHDAENGQETVRDVFVLYNKGAYRLYDHETGHEIMCLLDPADFKKQIEQNKNKHQLQAIFFFHEDQIYVDTHMLKFLDGKK